jgi:hypothetical protein
MNMNDDRVDENRFVPHARRALACIGFAFGLCAATLLWVPCLRAQAGAGQKTSLVTFESTPPGAYVYMDGSDKPLGATPLRGVKVALGDHTFVFRMVGYKEGKASAKIAARKETIRVTLSAVAQLAITAGNDAAQGAAVRIDGEVVGAIPFRGNYEPGRHMLQVNKEGFAPFGQWVELVAGQQLAMPVALEPVKVTGARLKVLSSVPRALVTLDGDVMGEAPVLKDGVTPGEHVLTVSSEGYETVEQTITLEAGKERVVSVRMVEASTKGQLTVSSNVSTATVTVDGVDRGVVPVVVSSAGKGVHTVVLRAEGYEEYRKTCDMGSPEGCNLHATLSPKSTVVRVRSNVTPAELYIDGQLAGPVPFEGKVPVGSRTLEVRSKGFDAHVQKVELTLSETPREFDIPLSRDGKGLTPEEQAARLEQADRERFGAVSHSAKPIPVDQTIVDASIGWPYFGELRLSTGIFDFLDAGVAIRSYGRLTEFEGRARIGKMIARKFSVGAQARLGGGIGPSNDGRPTNAWFLLTEAMASIHFTERGAATMFLGIDATTDRWDFQSTDSDALTSAAGSRQDMIRLRLGGTVEMVLNRDWNAWGTLEGILAGPTGGRRIYGDILGNGSADSQLYFRLGVSRKF